MEIAKRLKGTGEYYFSQKLREIEELKKAGHDIINLGIGNPDLPPHPEVIRVLQEESLRPDVHGYQSYKGSPVLRNAISTWYRDWYGAELDPGTEILPLMGSKEGILHICMTYINPGDRVLVPDPGYPTYQSAVQLAGGVCLPYRLRAKQAYEPGLEKIKKKELKKVKLMFVNYPQMPTGRQAGKGLFDWLVAFGRKHGIWIVHDNPYGFIVPDWSDGTVPLSMLSIKGAKDCVIELNSLSKSYNMAGWRVGMLCAAKEKIDEVLRFKSNMDSGMFLPVQLAAAKALSLGREWFAGLNTVYRTRREKVVELLKEMGCAFSNEQAGLFVWASIPKGYKDGFAFSDYILKQAGVFITPGAVFGKGGKKYIRVSLCNTEERLEESVQRIKNRV